MINKQRLFLMLFICLSLIVSDYAFGKERKGSPPPARVTVEKIQIREIRSTSKLVGTVISLKVSLVGSEVAGLVKKIKVQEGDAVKKGSPLVILENSQLLIAIKEAGAALDEEKQKLLMLENGSRPSEIKKAEAEADEAEILWKKQQQELKRVKNLFKRKLLSENEYMNTSLQADALEKTYIQKKEQYMLLKEGTRVEEIAMQTARVEIKKAQLDFLLDRKKKTRINAPFDGIVVKKFVEEGEWLDKGTQTVKIVRIDPIQVEVLAPEDAIYTLNKGDGVAIEVDAVPGIRFKGKISQIIPEASASSRTFPVRITLKNPGHLLKVGMTARVLISHGAVQKAAMAPQDALIISGNNTFVYKVGKDNTAEKVPVTSGISIKGWIELTGDLHESDMVITKGNERLRPGQPIVVY